jgi:hypothetical protein
MSFYTVDMKIVFLWETTTYSQIIVKISGQFSAYVVRV